MNTIMLYNSTATKSVPPNIVELSMVIERTEITAKYVIDSIHKIRDLAKDFIMRQESYVKDSYKQTAINLKKIVEKEVYYEHKTTKEKIDVMTYESMKATIAPNFEKKVEEKFIGYKATVYLNATIQYCESAVNDFANISNMSIENDIRLNYNFTLSKDLKDEVMQDLYAACINDGMKNILAIVNKTESLKGPVHIVEIIDPDSVPNNYSFSSAKNMSIDSANSMYIPEQIISIELVQDLFNNNIVFSKSLDLKVEV